MKELIKITENNGKKAVSARELYSFLTNNAENVTRWMQANISNNYYATENVDYQRIMQRAYNGRMLEDYVLTIDFAKELCMLSQCEKGKQARQYFIECEKQLAKILPSTYKEALKALLEEVEAKELAEAKVKELEPKAEIYDSISNAGNLLSLNDAAKSIGKIGRNEMMKALRERHVLRANNTPYQQYIDSGYFVVKVKPIKIGGAETNYTQTFVTSKGLIWLTKIL